MAILNSITIGKGRKSLGNVTLQTLGGVVVAKQKIMRNTSKSQKQQRQRTTFKSIMNVLRKFAPLARAAFSRVKTASAYARWARAFYAAALEFYPLQLSSTNPYALANVKYNIEGDFNVVEGNKVFSQSDVETSQSEPTRTRTIFTCGAALPGNKPINIGDDVLIEVAYCGTSDGKMDFTAYEVLAAEAITADYGTPQFVVSNGQWSVILPETWVGSSVGRYPIITVNNERIGMPFSLIADPA